MPLDDDSQRPAHRQPPHCRRCLQPIRVGECVHLDTTDFEVLVTHGACPLPVHNPAGAACWRVEGGGVYEDPPTGPEPGQAARVTLLRHLISEEPPRDAPGYRDGGHIVSFVGVVVASATWCGWDGDQYGDGDGYGPMAAYLWRAATPAEAAPVLAAETIT